MVPRSRGGAFWSKSVGIFFGCFCRSSCFLFAAYLLKKIHRSFLATRFLEVPCMERALTWDDVSSGIPVFTDDTLRTLEKFYTSGIHLCSPCSPCLLSAFSSFSRYIPLLDYIFIFIFILLLFILIFCFHLLSFSVRIDSSSHVLQRIRRTTHRPPSSTHTPLWTQTSSPPSRVHSPDRLSRRRSE